MCVCACVRVRVCVFATNLSWLVGAAFPFAVMKMEEKELDFVEDGGGGLISLCYLSSVTRTSRLGGRREVATWCLTPPVLASSGLPQSVPVLIPRSVPGGRTDSGMMPSNGHSPATGYVLHIGESVLVCGATVVGPQVEKG